MTAVPRTEVPSRASANEERSQLELASTDVSPGVARAMSIVFLLFVALVPLAQAVLDLRADGRVQALDVFAGPPTRSHLRAYEQALEGRAAPKQAVQPRLQLLITARLGAGNDRSIAGRGGWLFYQPGIDYAAGAGFLDADLLRLRATRLIDRDGERDPHPDPRPAIRALARDLSSAGIDLVLVPVPDKAMVESAHLTSRLGADRGGVMWNNPDWTRFASEMRAAGIDLFEVPPPADPTVPAYLEQDTHWTPAYMQQVAAAVALHIAPRLPAVGRPPFRTTPLTVARVGDLVDMLHLPAEQRQFAPRPVTIARVETSTGAPWSPRADADVLLVGDSFSNIYSSNAMGWGESAGFAEHLSHELGRPLDVIAVNGGASTAVRTLSRPETRPRLASKRLVVYEFAMRDLLGQNWPIVPLALAASPARAASEGELDVEGTIVEVSQVPDPVAAPYASCVSMMRVRVDQVVAGRYDARELIAGFLVMRNRTLLPPATFVPGDRLRLRLIPFDRADRGIRSLQRSDDVQSFNLESFWTVEVTRR